MINYLTSNNKSKEVEIKQQIIPKSFWSFIKWIYSPYKIWVSIYILFAASTGFYSTINSFLIKLIIDKLSNPVEANQVITVIFWPTLFFIINYETHSLLWRGGAYVNLKISPIIKNKIINEVFTYVHKHSYHFFQDNLSGSIANKVNLLANHIEKISYAPLASLIRGTVQFIIALLSMAFINTIFSLGLLAWAISFIIISIYFLRKLKKLSDDHAYAQSTLSGKIVDSITNANNVRIFANSNFEKNYLVTFLDEVNNKFRKKELYRLKLKICQGLSISTLLTFIVLLLAKLKSENLVEVGDFAFILTLTLAVTENIWWLTEQADTIADSIGQCNQSLKSLLIPLEIQDLADAKELNITNGEVKFHCVSFQYQKAKPLFNNKYIHIFPRQKVGLVGYSGSGKSTFVNLILRLFDVNSGSITIDGQDIRKVTQNSLRSNIGIIPQDPLLFHRSLMDNIRYGKISATDNEVINAAKRAHAHEFISKLPQGYNSLVGEHGIKLSGGQRQRIAIARAILKNAPILILDEATSQLDSITESKIQESLWSLMQNKTTIIIAHRLSTLLYVDRILMFDQGKIVEDGSHQQLLDKVGLYRTMWNSQVGGFLPDKKLE